MDVSESALVPEHLKPVIKKKSPLTVFPEEVISVSSNEEPNVSTPSALTPEQLEEIERLKQALAEEAKYKQYRVRVRDTWDEFGQTNVVRQELTQNEYRQRKTLLRKVKDFWIEGFLKPSLSGHNAINLDWKNSPNAVLRPFEVAEDLPVELDESFDELQTTDILNQTGLGQTLLILGEPGSGKTIALLQLAKKLINQSELDLTKPIPIVFNLSSWGHKQQPIEKWLIEELKDKYQVPQTWSELWLKQEQLILLLDGLDEVRAEQRNACVQALNQFIETHNITEMVVCSRVKDYEALTERLQLSSAICLKPLSAKQVYSFLIKAGDSLAGLKTLLQQDKELEQFAQTPLILNIMSWAYQDWSTEDLLKQFRSSQNRYRHLFDSYIERMLYRRVIEKLEQKKNSPRYSQEKVLHCLSWLGKTMVKKSQTVFLIEKMQPTWLQTRSEIISYRISNFLLGGLIIGLIVWLIFGLIHGLSKGLIHGLRMGLIHGIIHGLIVGLIFALIGGVIAGSLKEITLFEQMNWSWQKAKSTMIREVPIGLMYGLIFGLIVGIIEGLNVGLTLGSSFGLIFVGMGSGLVSTEVKQKIVSNQGIRSSSKNAIILVLTGGLIYGLSVGLSVGLIYGLIFGLIFGLIVGFKYGGATCLQHFNLRRILYNKGHIPWNYTHFLNYASERLLMKKVGGGYVFYHRMLMEHFAQRYQASREPVSVTPRKTSQFFAQAKTKTKVPSSKISAPVPQPSNPVHNYLVCSNCAHRNPINGKFCTKCGSQLIQED